MGPIMPWYTGILLAMAEFFAMHHIVTRVLLNSASYTEGVIQSPYYSGIIFGSMVWVAYCWVTRLVQQTQHHAFVHLSFAIAYGLCVYNFVRSITLDAGTCPKPANDGELRAKTLQSEGRLNGQTFCIQCMARKPLRSKHCRVCDKCVARHDHHCPWIWNCVGVNNHRQFILFVSTLVVGIILFDYLAFAYFSTIDSLLEPSSSCLLPDQLCAITAYDPFLFSVTCWATLQLLWTIVLLFGQLYQITRQMTTFEVSNLGRFGFMGGRGGTSLASQMGHLHQHGTRGAGEDAQPHQHQHAGCVGMLVQLTGLDAFTKGRAADGLARARKAANPFDLGVVGNCTDFWTKGRELGVEYEHLYDVPMEGFRDAKRRREKDEEDGGHGRKSKRHFMGFSLGIGRGNRAGYEPVSQV
ncbi:DHHC palmitoyltransferase-domain-containing protein [Phellopilus nigrolimitatus]|nr:DHHC palmitoyltransferase-domain-containing protein [Phellopilus nigrolimitatus]